MGEMTQEGANIGAGIDLSQFYQVFFEEAGENLDRMEAQLLEIDIEAADDEELNSIFRCAHSVKGGAATFGFADVAELTHQMETLLDKLRRHELTPTAAMVDVLLQSGDALRAQLARHQGAGGDAVDTSELLTSIRAMSSGQAPAPVVPVNVAVEKVSAPDADAQVAAASAAPRPAASAARELEVRVGPLKDPAQANNLIELFNEISDLGTIEAIDGGQPSDGMRRFRIVTTSTDSDLLDLFTFHVARDEVALLPMTAGYGFHAGAPGAPPESALEERDPGYGFFENAPGAP
ncbi:MAG: Hpt domain-containing protein, partial [Rhizobiales bacterium]|nr:Hpt domain-containing protein [Rhizobacter sp.]